MQPPPRALFPRNAKKKGTGREKRKKKPMKVVTLRGNPFQFRLCLFIKLKPPFSPLENSRKLSIHALTPSLHGWQTRHTLKGTFHPHSNSLSSAWNFSLAYSPRRLIASTALRDTKWPIWDPFFSPSSPFFPVSKWNFSRAIFGSSNFSIGHIFVYLPPSTEQGILRP